MRSVPACACFLFVLWGCDPCGRNFDPDACYGTSSSSFNEAGGSGTVLRLPFPEGEALRCTQGVGETYSHASDSTYYAIDLDTPNDSDMELYAPFGGIAHVHTESATSGFGYHVSIEMGEGVYVVVAHFREIFIADAEEVAAGQLLGYEGCTGSCSGDHVHVGLMEGDPSEMAQFGESVDVLFRAADMDAEEPEFADIAASAFACGATDGHVYASDLAVAKWHPDGTLVKVPNDPKTYVIEDGAARWLENEQTFWSYNYDFDNLTYVSDEELTCLGHGPDIVSEGSVDGGYGEDGDAWLLVRDTDGSAWKQRLPADGAEDVLESWGISGDLGMDPIFSFATLDAYSTRSGEARFRDGSILKEQSRSDVYVVSQGVALPVKDWDTFLLMGFGSRSVLTVEDGLISEVMGDDVGSCAADVWCLDREAVIVCGGGLEFGDGESGGEDVEDEADDSESEELDSDGDGVPDASDNCPWHDNGDQRDVDDDGLGDSCDADADGDGVGNGDDCDLFDASVGPCEEEIADTGQGSDTGESGGDSGEVTADSGSGNDGSEEDPDPENTDAWSDYIWIDGDSLCFSADGFSFPYDAADAYVVGYGGTALALDFTFQADFRLSNAGDAYCLDTSALDFDDYEATLVSSLDSSGGAATSYADTGDWWDNYDLCTSATSTSDQFCAFQGGWDYLVAFSVTSSGLHPNGDGA